MPTQTTSSVLMIEPVRFGYNPETAESNAFQSTTSHHPEHIQARAYREFWDMVRKLREQKIQVHLWTDTEQPHTPDSIFPNNWFSSHADGKLFIYPMLAENRRQEVSSEVIQQIQEITGNQLQPATDLTRFAEQQKFLEGTGSLVLDRVNRIAYACLSPRTSLEPAQEFAYQAGYELLTFQAQAHHQDVYHTNVLMALGSRWAIICSESIKPEDREKVLSKLKQTGYQLLDISLEQLDNYAGNALELTNLSGETVIVISQAGWHSLESKQREQLSSFGQILTPDIPTIETHGGGSVRCMLGELFLS